MNKPLKVPVSPLTDVCGWESEEEQNLLKEQAAKVPEDGLIVEIGSEYGMSASIFRKFSDPSVNIRCIEINKDAPFIHELARVGLDRCVVPVFADSKEVDPLLVLGNAKHIDLLFIDGDHSYGGALEDLTKWSRYISKNGCILVHDCACKTNSNPHPSHYEVYTALQHWLTASGSKDGWTISGSVDSTIVLNRINNEKSIYAPEKRGR